MFIAWGGGGALGGHEALIVVDARQASSPPQRLHRIDPGRPAPRATPSRGPLPWIPRTRLLRAKHFVDLPHSADLAAAYAEGRAVASTVYGIHASDPIVLLTATVVVVAITWVATAIPARRAARDRSRPRVARRVTLRLWKGRRTSGRTRGSTGSPRSACNSPRAPCNRISNATTPANRRPSSQRAPATRDGPVGNDRGVRTEQ